MNDKSSIHDGHRERMRERIKNNGVETLQPHEALEYLLFSFVPRRDTNEIAHALIKEFGSLAGVLSADAEHLAAVPGVTENAALFLSSLTGVFRMYLNEKTASKQSLSGRGAARMFMGNKLFGVDYEQVYVAALDARDGLIGCELVGTGTGDSVNVAVRTVVDFALKSKASGVILAHNHPSGVVQPSQADVEFTYLVLDTLSNVGVKLLDHFVFCGEEYYSFEEDGRLSRMHKTTTTLKEGIKFYD